MKIEEKFILEVNNFSQQRFDFFASDLAHLQKAIYIHEDGWCRRAARKSCNHMYSNSQEQQYKFKIPTILYRVIGTVLDQVKSKKTSRTTSSTD